MVVVDASVATKACLSAAGFAPLGDEGMCAPALLWSETAAALRQLRWRRVIDGALASEALERLLQAPIEQRDPRMLLRDAWRIASELGWAKTYDAEYLALARHLKVPLVTIDARLRRAARGIADVRGPTEL